MKRSATFALAASLSLAAQADVDPDVVNAMLKTTSGISREVIVENYNDCDSGITFPMTICFAYRWVAEDIRLNHEYKKTLEVAAKVDANKALRAAQRTWVSYRDAECAFQGEIEAGGGTAEGIAVLACKQKLTRIRADQLMELTRMYSESSR